MTLALSLKFPLNPSANQRAKRECQRKCDSEKDCSRKRLKAIELLMLKVSGSTDNCYQLKTHKKTDVMAKQYTAWT